VSLVEKASSPIVFGTTVANPHRLPMGSFGWLLRRRNPGVPPHPRRLPPGA
jgi:hypothetical protein